MRDTTTQSPFVLFSTHTTFENAEANTARADEVSRQLGVAGIPFRPLALKVFGVEGDAPVFLVPFEDRGVAIDIARANNQSHFIDVNAFRVGTRVALDGREDGIVGQLEEALYHTLNSGEGYLQQPDGTGPTWIWK